MMRRFLSILGVLAFALALSPRPVAGYDCAGLKGLANLSRESVECSDYEPLSVAWQVAVTGPVLASPAVVNGRVYVATRAGHIYCLDAASGATLWELATDDGTGIDGSPTVVHGRVYLATGGGVLACLRADTGAVLWRRNLGTECMSSPLVANGMVVLCLGSPSREVAAFSELTGDELWRFDTGQCSYSSPVEYRGLIYVGSSNGDYYAIDFNGSLAWHLSTNGNGLVGMSSVEPRYGRCYLFPGGFDPNLYCVRADTGSIIWQGNPAAPPPPGSGDPTLDPQFFQEVLSQAPADRQAYIQAWAEARGEPAQQRLIDYQLVAGYTEDPTVADNDFPAPPPFLADLHVKPSSPAVGSNRVVFATKNLGEPSPRFSVVCMNALDGQVCWYYQQVLPAAKIACASTPAIAVDRVLVGMGSHLMTFDLSSGALLDDRALNGDLYSSPAIANGLVVAATLNGQVYAFQTANHAPTAPDGPVTPGEAEVVQNATPTLTWTPGTDPDTGHPPGALRYLVEIDDDGELDLSADQFGTPPGQTSLALPSMPDASYVWRVRTCDPDGALSPWSVPHHFAIDADGSSTQLQDPRNLAAVPGHEQVVLLWQPPAAGPVFDGYKLTVTDEFGQQRAPIMLGKVQSTVVRGLTNFVGYTFKLQAWRQVDSALSPGATAAATPIPLISLNGQTYRDLDQALRAARSGDTILLGTGTIHDRIRTNKTGITLRGVAPGYTILRGGNRHQPVVELQQGAEVTLAMMTITHGEDGVLIRGEAQGTLRNVLLMDLENGIHVKHQGTLSGIHLTISDNSQHGIWFEPRHGNHPSVHTATLRNNIISYHGGKGIQAPANGSAITATYTDFFTNAGGDTGGNAQAGTGCLTLDPMYHAKAPDDYRLEPESPCVNAADPADPFDGEPDPDGGRADMGCYGNTLFGLIGEMLPVPGPGCFLSAASQRR